MKGRNCCIEVGRATSGTSSSLEGPRPDATHGIQWILDTLSSDEHEVIVKATSAGLLFDVLVNHNSCGYFMMKTIVKMLPEKDLKLPELLYHGISDSEVIEGPVASVRRRFRAAICLEGCGMRVDELNDELVLFPVERRGVC
jgi:hypothetical protein